MSGLLEICVDSYESAMRAFAGGADRLELCGCLQVGGISPSPWLIRQVVRDAGIPVHVLVRPRFGDFCFTRAEKQQLLREAEAAAEAGASGVVLGALTAEGELDEAHLAEVLSLVPGLKATLHRCFDVCRDPFRALEQAKALGFSEILTSGQQPTAPQGAYLLAQLQRQAEGIFLLAGSGVNPDNIPAIHAATGITHYHFSAKRTENGPMRYRREGVPMGLPMAGEFDRWYCDETLVRRAAEIVHRL